MTRAIISSVAMVTLAIAAVMLVQTVGSAGRVSALMADSANGAGSPIRLVKTTSDVLHVWHQASVKGRIVVHVGRYLHFVPVDGVRPTSTTQLFPFDPLAGLADQISEQNFLWFSMRNRVAREVHTVLPPEVMRMKLEAAALDPDSDLLELRDLGNLRVLRNSLPTLIEPVLLNLDASYFDSTAADGLAEALVRSGLRWDVATLCLAIDNPLVSDRQRTAALAWAEENHDRR